MPCRRRSAWRVDLQPLAKAMKAKREREEPCFICSHYHDVCASKAILMPPLSLLCALPRFLLPS